MTIPTSPAPGRRSVLRAGALGVLSAAVLAHRPPTASAATAGTSEAPAATARGASAVTESLCGGWRFGRARAGGLSESFDDGTLALVTLPHTVTALSWRNWDPRSWSGSWLYRRTFDLPEQLQGLRVFADFEGVMTQATPVFNGQSLPTHTGGYLPFSLELTDHLRPTGNVLALEVDSTFSVNVPPNRGGSDDPTTVDFWQPGGVYRPVRLRGVPTVFIADVFAKPVDVLGTGRRIEVEVTVDAGVVPTAGASVEVEVVQDGTTVARATGVLTISATGRVTTTVTVGDLQALRLWSVDEPNLCRVVTTLKIDEQPVHDHLTVVGLREARFETDGLYLNGKRLQVFGLNRHQVFPFAGGALSARVQRKDAQILRQVLNCNMVRCSHYPQSQDFYDACDELGLLVFLESPGWGQYIGDDVWKQRVRENVHDMVVANRNHPSVVLWGARLNEAGSTAAGITLFTETRAIVRGLDDSRQTTGAMLGGGKNLATFEQDVFAINEYARTSSGEANLTAPRNVDSKPYLVSECVGALSGPASTYRRIDPVADQQGQAYAHARVHHVGGSSTRYAGVIPWAAFDYPSGSGRQVDGIKHVGVVDLFREPKLGAAIYRAQVDPSRHVVIEPAFYWDFGPGSTNNGPGTAAMICSNAERLEVYVADEHRATVVPDRARFGNLRFPPSFVDLSGIDGTDRPELRIDAYIGDALVASRRLSSQESGDRLEVVADDDEIDADGSDATRVVFRVVDRYGAPRPYVGGQVTIDVRGPGRLVGDRTFDLAAAGGVGAVWLRTRPNEPGRVTVTVSHPAYGSVSTALTGRNVAPGAQPIGETDLRVSAAPYMAAPGQRVVVSARLTNSTGAAIRNVQLRLPADAGWSPAPITPVTATIVQPGASFDAQWELIVDGSVKAGTHSFLATAVYESRAIRAGAEAEVSVAVPTTLAAARNNVSITDDADWTTGDLDGVGNTFSLQALTAAGVVPGSPIPAPADRVPLVWPVSGIGVPDNVLASGQTIAVSGTGTRLAILGATSRGPLTKSGVVHYEDGTTAVYRITVDDYFNPPSANLQAIKMPYMNANNNKADNGVGGRRTRNTYLFYAEIPVRSDVRVVGVTLPAVGDSVAGGVPAMHIVDVAVG
ncbi:glycoside hydrolase family 2 TIM barrel-domain containing protein [Intrasporangium mesophilum]